MCKILVTGGAGFIGSHTCVALLEAGHTVVIADNLCNAKEVSVERIAQITGTKPAFYQADIRDQEAMYRILTEHEIDTVIHFAGLKAVGESVAKPMLYYQNNIYGTLQLLEAMQRAGCKKIVFSSSATVYGADNVVPYQEEMPTSSTNPYGRTKVMIEQILRDLCVADPEWSVAALRYFNPIGAHESGLIGEDPNGIPNNLLPYIAKVAIGALPMLHVYGNDYDTPDGTGVRDYIHVMDLAAGHVAALKHTNEQQGFRAYNLGTGNGYSVLEVAKAFEKASGREIPLQMDPRRPGDIATSYADATRAKEELGWTAKRNLEQMCADGWNFTCKNPNGLE